MVDENLVVHCDGSKKLIELKHDWVEKVLEKDPHHMELYSVCYEQEPVAFQATISDFKLRLNQSGGTVCAVFCFTSWTVLYNYKNDFVKFGSEIFGINCIRLPGLKESFHHAQ